MSWWAISLLTLGTEWLLGTILLAAATWPQLAAANFPSRRRIHWSSTWWGRPIAALITGAMWPWFAVRLIVGEL